jgi:hypothetical protein
MPHYCPECGHKLATSYLANKPIQDIHHNGPKKCPGIGQLGKFGHEQSRNQKKTQERTAGIAESKVKKDRQSARNIGYQTPLKNEAKQQERVNMAVATGLGGHFSQDSNSKQNQNTTGGLNVINNATRENRK